MNHLTNNEQSIITEIQIFIDDTQYFISILFKAAYFVFADSGSKD